jgi:hypothetical protein
VAGIGLDNPSDDYCIPCEGGVPGGVANSTGVLVQELVQVPSSVSRWTDRDDGSRVESTSRKYHQKGPGRSRYLWYES